MAEIQLRGGFKTSDPRLDRLPQSDPRNRQFDIADHPRFGAVAMKGRTWAMNERLDQGREGACTGFARAHDFASSPHPLPNITNEFAQALYKLAQKYDEWPGEEYSGSSVLGALKAAKVLGFIGEYRWAFDIDDLILALATLGPVVMGTDWTEGMFNTRPNGLLVPEGNVAGGHSYMLRGVILSKSHMRRVLNDRNEPLREGCFLVRGTNSWDKDWGINGEFLMWSDDVERLLKGLSRWPGEAAITTQAFIPIGSR